MMLTMLPELAEAFEIANSINQPKLTQTFNPPCYFNKSRKAKNR
jgi:hypothetical protein